MEKETLSKISEQMKSVIEYKDCHKDVQSITSHPLINVTELPSRFLSYPIGTKISYRPYSWGESKKSAQSNMSFKEHVDFVLKGIYADGLTNMYDLTYHDFLYLSLLRRLHTVGKSDATISFNCAECGEYNNWTVNNFDFEFNDATIPELPVNIEINGKKYSFGYLTLKKIIPLVDNNLEKDSVALLAARCINRPFDEAYSDFDSESMTFDDGILLEEISKMLYHGMKPMNFVCKSCKYNNSTILDIKQIIISPFRDKEGNFGNRITFGNEA